MSATTRTGIPAWSIVLAVIAAPACGATSGAARSSDGGADATIGSTVSTECPATACTGSRTCVPWAALCGQQIVNGQNVLFCAACSGSLDSPSCDQEYCGQAYPALADSGTLFGDCDTTTGRCRCYVISDDGGVSGYLDEGGVSCARGVTFDGGWQQEPWLCPDPQPLPEGGTCSLPPFSPQVFTVTLWFDDYASTRGGWTVTLGPNESATMGGHVYRNSGGGRVGAGPLGSIEGDVLLDVDGVPGQLRFHHSGCASQFTQVWEYPAALTRTNPLCPSCGPSTVGRQFAITSPADGSTEYDFVAQGQPSGCGVGVDLIGFTTR